jgi:hypothetical protein
MKVALDKLFAILGERPINRGYHVSLGETSTRTAHIVWNCASTDAARQEISREGCGSMCMATNQIPYESDTYPDENWDLNPCVLHQKLFSRGEA